MTEVGFFSALLGGILTFLAPCTFPLIPAYMGFLSGGAAKGKDVPPDALRRVIVKNALLFVAGFSLVFMVFGLVSGVIGSFLVLYRALLTQVAGILVIGFGLLVLLKVSLPTFFQGGGFPAWLSPGAPFSSFLLGVLFGVGWSPCLGPILGTILLLAGGAGTALSGALLLFVYSLGLAIPFLLVAYLYGTAFSYVFALGKYLPLIERIAGVFLIVIGILLLVGKFGMFNVWADVFFSGGWYGRIMDLM